jgi:hypothetical protein
MSYGGSYMAGQGVRVSVAFTDSNGNAVDPTTVTLKFAAPDGTSGPNNAASPWTYGGAGSIVKDSTGNYHAVLDTTGKPGEWTYEWIGSGSVLAPAAANFYVAPLPL